MPFVLKYVGSQRMVLINTPNQWFLCTENFVQWGQGFHELHPIISGDHMNCNIPFDGDGGDLAHSWLQGNIHFDDAEEYTRSMRMDQSGIVLLRVAVHEIGHVLGLDHVAREYSIMYSKYPNYTAQLELDWEDRKDAQAIYGLY